MTFQQIKLETSVTPLFVVFISLPTISDNFTTIQGQIKVKCKFQGRIYARM